MCIGRRFDMRTIRRLGLVSMFGVLGIAVVATSVAFACSPNATFSSNTTFGPPGSEVLVTGGQFYEDGNHGPVEIRWSSVTGNNLGSHPGPSFSVAVRIPDAQPGTYYIVAVQRRLDDGSIAGKRSVAFTVESSAPEPTPTSPSPSPEPAATSPSPEPTPTSQSTPPTSSSSPTPSGSSSPTTSSNENPSPAATPSPAGSSSAAPAPSAPASASASTRGASVGRPSPAERSQGVGGTAAAPPASAATPVPAVGDLSAAVSADAPANADAAGPGSVPAGGRNGAPAYEGSLASLIDSESSAGGGPSFAVGVGLLAIGLMAVFASFCVAHVRRRTPATVRGRRP